MRHKKTLAFISITFFVMVFFACLPEIFNNIAQDMSSTADAKTVTGVAVGVYIDADYSTSTLTAVLTDSDGEDIVVATGTTVTYQWSSSTDDSNYTDVSGATSSTFTFGSNNNGYYYKVKVTVNSTDYTSVSKKITTDIASAKIQNDIYRDSVLTAVLLNSEGDVLYYDDGSGDKTTYAGSDATYSWYSYTPTSNAAYLYTDESLDYYTPSYESASETTSENTLTPTMGTSATYYYVEVALNNTTYKSPTRIATVYAGITVEIEQTLEVDGDITLQMIIYDDNGDVMKDEKGGYYYNTEYTTTWYKSKEYFASTGDGTTADDDSEVETDSTAPLGYAPQDYYSESNYMRVSDAVYNATSNTVGYTDNITVSGEVGRYYYVDINTHRTNGSAEAGATPVFVRNCKNTVVVEDHIVDDGTYRAVVYDTDGAQVDDTSGYTFTWYKTVSGTTTYIDSARTTQTSDEGRYVSSWNNSTYTNSAYYFDSGKFYYNWSSTAARKTSEFGSSLPNSDDYDEVHDNFSDELDAVNDVFVSANYQYTNDKTGFNITDGNSSKNDGSTCNVANDDGQLRYYYVVASKDSADYTSLAKYVKYSNQIENGGFEDTNNSTTYDSSLTTYWQTTNAGYADTSAGKEPYYRLRPLLELSYYTSANSYGTYGNYYSFPGLSYDKDSLSLQTMEDNYYALTYDTDSTDEYLQDKNQFCEINSTDNNTLYQTVMTVPGMPLYWSITHHARTSSGYKILSASASNATISNFSKYTDSSGSEKSVNTDIGATTETVYVAIDIMYVVIMNEKDAEALLANADTLTEKQNILNSMVYSITNSSSPNVSHTSKDGMTYQARYDSSYTYSSVKYDNISIWKLQTGSTKVELGFGTYTTGSNDASTAKSNAETAVADADLMKYYAEKYGIVKAYTYNTVNTTANTTTYYTTYYTESKTYDDTYNIPDDQYVSRYFFVAGSSSNTPNWSSLSFGTYEDENKSEQTISSYNNHAKATNTDSAGNFIDNAVFAQTLRVKINYWKYDCNEGKYVLDKTEQQRSMPRKTVTATYADDYYSQYRFVGSYVSADGGDEDSPDEYELGTDTSFTVYTGTALVMDLYYQPYKLSIDKTILGLSENNMTYADFENKLQITLYALTDTAGSYIKGDPVTSVNGVYLEYNKDGQTGEETLTFSTDYVLTKGTYLITETTYLLLTDLFEGWDSVDMYLADGMLTYDNSLDGYILVIGEDSDEAGTGEWDSVIELSILNTYKPVAVQSTKSVLLGETDVDDINKNKLGSDDPDSDTTLVYQSLTKYDSDRSVDDAGITDDSERLSVLSGDTLTYRMELASTGRSSSQNVVVTDTVPDGCTLQADSIQILKQNRLTNTNYYGVVKTVLSSSGSGSVDGDVTTWSYTDGGDTFKIKYDSSNDEITWEIPSIASTEQYYVEYAVTVDQIYPSTESELLTNTAQWTYLSKVNTSTGMTMITSTDGSTTSYTSTFSELSDCTVTMISDKLPDGFTIDTGTIKVNGTSIGSLNYTITYYDANGDVLSGSYNASDIVSFAISYDSGITQSNNTITLTFSGTQSVSGSSDVDIRNTAGITYNKGGSDIYTCCVALGNGITNEVETDVTHLYLEVDKSIVESDTSTVVDSSSTDTEQTFLFIVKYYSEDKDPDNDEADSVTYVTINCDSGTGSRLVQVDKRGTYTVAEVSDWSNTDYDYIFGGYLDDTYVDDDLITIDFKKGSTYVGSAGAFATTLGLTSGDHATATFYNTKSTYAYRSSQAYAKNDIE